MMISTKMKNKPENYEMKDLDSKNNKKVILGLSGGVDSTAAALLLQEKGYEVIGLYFDALGLDRDGDYCSCGCEYEYRRGTGAGAAGEAVVVAHGGLSAGKLTGRARAELAAKQLGIKLIYKDVSNAFNDIVIDNFCSEYMKGRTPNPCIICNPNVKFKVLLAVAEEEGASYIATGHYADTYYDEEEELWYIKRAANEKKDQSYMLYRLGQDVISRLILPLNDAEDKEQIRELARAKALKNADDKDSQEICFVDSDDNYKDYIRRRGFDTPKGKFVDRNGKVLGEHQGILNYTIGQRKGLGIALGKPAFVTDIDGENNQVVLGENADLFKTEVISSDNIICGVWLEQSECAKGIDRFVGSEVTTAVCKAGGIKAKIRYAARPAEASIEILADGRVKAVFEEPQRAATPGQSIVFYRDNLVIGGGFIDANLSV